MSRLAAALAAAKSRPATSVVTMPAAASAASIAASMAGSTSGSVSGRTRATAELAGSGREARFDQAHAPFDRGHVGAERADRVQGPRQRVDALDRHPAPGRLQAHDAAASGRDPDRTAGVGAQAHVRLAGGDRDRRAAGRAAGHAQRVGRVHRRPGPGVGADRGPAQLGQVGLAQDLSPGPAGRGHHGRVPVGGPGPLGDHRAADGGRQARDVDAVLDREPHARCSVRRPSKHDPGRAGAVVIHGVILAPGGPGGTPRASAAKKSRTLCLEVMAAAALRS